jgi:hypothetical protein
LQLALELPAQGTNLFVFSRGEFRASERADGQIFLALLAEKLNAANWTASTDKTNRLAFTAAIMGTNLQHGVTKDSQIAGLFNSEMPGDWIVTKTFFGDGELEAYLAINPVEREAMIYRKDDESGPEIVREFSRLFEFGAKPEPK